MTGDFSPFTNIRTPDPHRQVEQAQVDDGLGLFASAMTLLAVIVFGLLLIGGLFL